MAVTGSPPLVEGVTYGADMRLLVNVGGIPTVLFGPGDVRVAHMPDEYVPIDQLRAAAEALVLTAVRFCGVESRPLTLPGLRPPTHSSPLRRCVERDQRRARLSHRKPRRRLSGTVRRPRVRLSSGGDARKVVELRIFRLGSVAGSTHDATAGRAGLPIAADEQSVVLDYLGTLT